MVFTPEERPPKLILMGGPLASNFSVSHLAFYWGQSKHTLDGQRWALIRFFFKKCISLFAQK